MAGIGDIIGPMEHETDGAYSEFVRCIPWLQAALDAGGNTHTIEDLFRSISVGRMQFWPAPRGCAVTEIVVYPRRKTLHIFLAGGEMDQIVDMDGSAAEFARANGCDGMSICGRRGWVRVLKDNGWKETMTTLVKEI